MDYSIQLYSVHKALTRENFDENLGKIAEMGYTAVEPCGFYEYTPGEINAMLKKHNLKLSGTHSAYKSLVEDFDNTLEFHKAIGNPNYIIPGGVPISNQKEIDEFVENANRLQEKLAAHGINLCYHNHSGEFVVNADGSMPYEQMILRTNIDLEVDVYWAFRGLGNKNPIDLLNRIENRIKCIHLKDGLETGHGKPLGQGDAPIAEIFAWAKEKGKLAVVENESDPLKCMEEAKMCIDYLKTL